MKDISVMDDAEIALKKCFEDVSFIRILSLKRNPETVTGSCNDMADIQVDIKSQASGKVSSVIAEVKNNGQPRIARNAVNQLLLCLHGKKNSYGMFIAPYISNKAAEICLSSGVGYLDLAGNCHISFDEMYLHIVGKKNPFPQNRDLKTLFSAKATRVLRILLNDPSRPWKVKDLEQESGISIGHVSKVKKCLFDWEMAEDTQSGFKLTKPEEVLDEWSKKYSYHNNKIFRYYSMKDGATIEKELNRFCSKNSIPFALTMFCGASRVAPYAKYKEIHAYVEKGSAQLLEELELKPFDTGCNVVIMEPYDNGIFMNKILIDEMPVVSAIQLYLDLKRNKARGEEAADFLMETVIKPSWEKQ